MNAVHLSFIGSRSRSRSRSRSSNYERVHERRSYERRSPMLCLEPKAFGTNGILGQKDLEPKGFWAKKIWNQKDFGIKRILESKGFGTKRILEPNR